MKNNNLSNTAEFKIKRKQKKSMKLWQKILIGLSLTILIIAILLVISWIVIKNTSPESNTDIISKKNDLTYYLMDENGNFYESAEGVYIQRPYETYELDETLEFQKDSSNNYLLDEYGNYIRTDYDASKNLEADNVIRYLKDANGNYTENANGIYVQIITVKYEIDNSLDFKVDENGEYLLDDCGNPIRLVAAAYYLMDEEGNFYESAEGVYLQRPSVTYELDESLEFQKDSKGKYLLDKYGNRIRADHDDSKELEADNIIRFLKDASGNYVENVNGIYVQKIEISYEIDYSLNFKTDENGEYLLDDCDNLIRSEAQDNIPDNPKETGGKLKLKNKTYNFLVLGCDRAGWLTDVIMIATYDIPKKKLSIMQVPRDTYVFVNDTLILDDDGNIGYENFDGIGNDKPMKINAAAWHGGLLAENELNRLVRLAGKQDSDVKKICRESFLNITEDELTAYISASGSKKKNLAYNIKLDFGIEYLQALITRSFGTPIDFYAHMNLNGFANIVNAIDGVDVYVPEDMDYEDVLQNPPLIIHLKKGQQHLDGKKAEQFIRFRYGYAAADIARIDAQKIFMTAFIKKVFSLDGLMNIDKLVEEVTDNLTTNISLTDAVHFATNALDLDFSEILMLTMPGDPKYVGNVSYYCVDKKTLIEYVNAYHNKYTTDLSEDYFCVVGAADKNTSTTPLTAEDIKNNQPNLGFMY